MHRQTRTITINQPAQVVKVGKEIMKTSNSISKRMMNLMNAYIGKTYKCFYEGSFLWFVTIKSIMGETGYFITELNNGKEVWQSNASYGEITKNLKKGIFAEA